MDFTPFLVFSPLDLSKYKKYKSPQRMYVEQNCLWEANATSTYSVFIFCFFFLNDNWLLLLNPKSLISGYQFLFYFCTLFNYLTLCIIVEYFLSKKQHLCHNPKRTQMNKCFVCVSIST